MNVKSWPKLIFSIILAQSAGLIGTIFTFDAIPTWYITLTRPVLAPPNWVFGPVWTILYTLIGISLYLIWTNKKGSLKLFLFHLFLNAIWSPIFFGLKNLGLAFIVILLMDITLVVIIKNFYKINRLAAYLLVLYLLWISFATILNFSFWQLNKNNLDVFAQDFTFTKAREDYIFTEDNYKKDLFDFNLKKASYQQNQTLSLKEELRLSLYKLVGSRNNLIKSYLTVIRVRTVELDGLNKDQKEQIYSKIDPEVVWYENRSKNYEVINSLEDILNKSKEEDKRYIENTLPIIYFSLANTSLGRSKSLKNSHISLYNKLKNESGEIVKLGRADASLFNRWFGDIDQELNLISDIEKNTEVEISKIISVDDYKRGGAYKKSIQTLSPIKDHLLKLNGFIKELESVTANKR